MKKTLFVLLLTYIIYSFFFLKPNSIKNFLLVDDGQILHQSTSYLNNCLTRFDCGLFLDQTFEFGTSRFRPIYWVINNINFYVLGDNASWHHIYRVNVVGTFILITLFLLLKQLKISNALTFLFSLVFITNFSFTENIIRLGTNEPYQIIFFGLFSLFYLSKSKLQDFSSLHFLLLSTLLTLGILIKENGIAIIPVVFITELLRDKKRLKNLRLFVLTLIPTSVLILGMVLSKFAQSSISQNIPIYTSNYTQSISAIFQNALSNMELIQNSMSPLLKLSVVIGIYLLFNKSKRHRLFEYKFAYWIMFSVFFIGILFPWKYVMDRYQLIGIFGVCITMAFLFDKFINVFRPKLNIHLFNILFVFVLSNLFFRGFSLNYPKSLNYINWFNTFTKFESDQVNVIHKYNNDKLYLNAINNIDNWEFLYEVPIHLKHIKNANSEIKVLSAEAKTDSLIFSSSILEPVVKENNVGLIIESKDYSQGQIDVLKFRESFIFRPIQTIMNPPLSKDAIKYRWGVRRV